MGVTDKIKDLWNWISPRRTHQQHQNPRIGTKTPTRSSRPGRRLPSPLERRRQQQDSSNNVESSRVDDPFEPVRRYSKAALPPSRASSSTESHKSQPTSTSTSTRGPTPESNAALPEIAFGEVETDSESEGQDHVPPSRSPKSLWEDGAIDDTIVIAEPGLTTQRRQQIEHIISKEDLDRKKDDGWNDDQIELYTRLRMRGYEPLLPETWELDFDAIPVELFTEHEEAYIRPKFGSDFRASRAFERLLSFPASARDALETTRRPEKIITSGISDYLKWAMADGKLDTKPILPLTTIIISKPKEEHADFKARVKRQALKLANAYRDAHRIRRSVEGSRNAGKGESKDEYEITLPAVYGFAIKGTTLALVSLDPNAEEEVPKMITISSFDFKEVELDFWSALAVAISVVHVQGVLSKLAEGMSDISKATEVDPDA